MPAAPIIRGPIGRLRFAPYGGEPDVALEAITGTLAVTLADVTSAAAGASGAAGTLAQTLANLTSAAAGGSGASGTLARTLGDITSAAAGSGASGTVAVTLANATFAASGTFLEVEVEVIGGIGGIVVLAGGIGARTIGRTSHSQRRGRRHQRHRR